MGDLQRITTQAELSPVMYTHGGLVLSQEGRTLKKNVRREVVGGLTKKTQIVVAREVTMDAMDSIADVDAHRQLRAGSDPVLNQLLLQHELAHQADLDRIQRGSAF